MAKPKYTKKISVDKDGVHKEICCREVENGYVIDIYKSWEDKEKGYQSESKTYISEKNPLEKKFDKKVKMNDGGLQDYFEGVMSGM